MATHHIDLHVLLERVASQIAGLAETAGRLQCATSSFPSAVLVEHCETLQELDYLHQHLTSLSGFVQGLSIALPDVCVVDAKPHLDDILLSRLCGSLLGVQHETPATPTLGDVDLFNEVA